MLGKKAISDCHGFVLRVHEQPISADSDFEDKKQPNLCIAEKSKLKQRIDVGVISSLHKCNTLSLTKKSIYKRLVLFWRKEACHSFVNN